MAGIIMTCSSLRRHVDAAQKKENTAYEVYELDSRLHAEPKEMRAAVFEAMKNLPEQVDTVLLSMGLCGGSVSERPLPVRAVSYTHLDVYKRQGATYGHQGQRERSL